MPRFFVFTTACVIFLSTSSRGQQQNIVPRKTFFTGSQRFDFKMPDAGDRLYFRADGNPTVLYFLDVRNPEHIDSIPFASDIKAYLPSDAALLTIRTDSTDHLMINKEQVDPGVMVRSMRFISAVKEGGLVALEIMARNEDESGIYVLNIGSGSFERKYDLQPFTTVFLDDGFNLVAANGTSAPGGSSMSYFRDGEWYVIENHEWFVDQFTGGFSKIISVSDDGDVIYLTSNLTGDKTRLYKFVVSDGSMEELAGNDLVDLLPFGASVNSRGEVTSVVGLYARTIREMVDPEIQPDFEWLDEQIEGDISFVQTLGQDDKWLIREFTGGPSKMYLCDRRNRQLTYLVSDYPALDGVPLARRHAFAVPSSDGLVLPVHVYLPPGSDADGNGIPDRPLPTVFYVHGGPWVGVFHWNQYFHWRNFQLLANRGYAVVNCEFRGGTGLGKAFAMKSVKDWGGQMLRDKLEIAAWAVKRGISDENKRCIWGWSYGGYAALQVLAVYPKAFACGMSMYGISDLEAFCKTPFADNEFWKSWVGDPGDSTDAEMLRAASPVSRTSGITAPLLLTTGGMDDRVPRQQSDTMAGVLAGLGKEVIYLYYPEEQHDYREAGSWISYWAVAEQFLKEHLGGRAQPLGGDLQTGKMDVIEGKDWIKNLK